MTHQEYLALSKDLQTLVKKIPLNWGTIQNDGTDSKIKMFLIHSYTELEKQILDLDEPTKNYFRKRWFLWKCAQCDEHLFCINSNVVANPNSKDQAYDVEFNNNQLLRFDIKGTVIPKEFRKNIAPLLLNPIDLINFYYEKQSSGVRQSFQNRLFIVHHSHLNPHREMYLRCHWAFKENVYKTYSAKLTTTSNFIGHKNAKADVIFIIENLDKTITHHFCAIR